MTSVAIDSIDGALALMDQWFADARRRSETDLLLHDLDPDALDGLLAAADASWGVQRAAIVATLRREGLRP